MKMKIGDTDANGLRRGSELLFQAPQGYLIVAILPAVPPHFPEELMVLAPSGEDAKSRPPATAYDLASILERLNALVEATDRHRTQSKKALAMLGYDS